VLGTSGNSTDIRDTAAVTETNTGQPGRVTPRRGLCSAEWWLAMGQSLGWAGAAQGKVSGKGQEPLCRPGARLTWPWAGAAPRAGAGCSLGPLSPHGNPLPPPNLRGEAAHYLTTGLPGRATKPVTATSKGPFVWQDSGPSSTHWLPGVG